MELVLVTGIFAVVSVFLLRIYLTADHLRGEAVAISTATVRAQGVAEAVRDRELILRRRSLACRAGMAIVF